MAFSSFFGSASKSNAGEAAAIRRSQAVIEFTLEGQIIDANDNFLRVVGYSKDDVVGKHHSIFLDATYASSEDYKSFWQRLARGEAFTAEFMRVGKGGRLIWLQATYTPILDRAGKPVKVIKFATDITAIKGLIANFEGESIAIRKSQPVIEFDLAGYILDANQHFLDALGYTIDEIKGKHHSIFVRSDDRRSDDYKRFWQKLGQGNYDAAQYLRVTKSGREIWIQATYNPILDALGKPYKVVKYLTDITTAKPAQDMLSAAVEETKGVVQASKSNDLTARVPLSGKSGDIAILCSGVNDLLDTVTGILRTVAEISGQIFHGTSRINADSHALAQRTEEQASSLEETAATTEELAASVKHSSQRAREATKQGQIANEIANRGGTIVADAIVAMERIEKASGDIAEIITVIDNIAFQTNLLALNAAVEAARAGDAGKGFAVVASEVRALAQRSSEAANDIKKLITNSEQEVAAGVKLVKGAGSALSEIVASSTSVAAALNDISSASDEQANGIEEVAKVVAHMDDMTQQNSAMAEQSLLIASQLHDATNALQSIVDAFRVCDVSVMHIDNNHYKEPLSIRSKPRLVAVH
ncbi:MAG: methyl-accepting chemotaxis protein [Bosea sp. (in: a-proteobacteria)]|uniref:methyl-accepting chemotaxis protein n=1 Tax=Bosea sp. (in: a-proteobacteria) TaxID=1871050 RepID=UPI002737340A|nr:methyl-accepting chemotaxis protein [Bosea sp. (in: a-proteobacteria)]MDP3600914.1 methyl-accepting chemotaxis protein [Bosea sp. (in: a-proteobacteria)]